MPNYEPLTMRSIPRFFLFRSGKALVAEENMPCRGVWRKKRKKSIFEVSIDNSNLSYILDPSPYEIGYFVAKQEGFEVRICQFCKYHKYYQMPQGSSPIFCCLYKKFGTPENPETVYAKECKYYREDSELLNKIQNAMPSIVVASYHNDIDNT